MNPFRSVGARLSLALALVVAGALTLVYLIVIPSLQQRLIHSKLSQLKTAVPQIKEELPPTQFGDWQSFLESASSTADARVVVYTILTPATKTAKASVNPIGDSHIATGSRDVANDPIAQRAADTFAPASGTVTRGETRYAEVAVPVSLGTILMLSGSLHDALANVDTVRARLVEAGVLALALAIAIGYGAAYVFARRIRRLEAAAERIASGSFDEPVRDPSPDELGQLARAFERMRMRLSQLERARR